MQRSQGKITDIESHSTVEDALAAIKQNGGELIAAVYIHGNRVNIIEHSLSAEECENIANDFRLVAKAKRAH